MPSSLSDLGCSYCAGGRAARRTAVQRLLILLLAAGLLGGCGQMRPMGARSDLVRYTVEPGDTLYSISWRYGYDYHEVAAWNGISTPYNIYPGQRLLLISPYQGQVRERPAGQGEPVPAPTGPGAAVATAIGKREKAPSAAEITTPRHQSRDIDWRWPTSGNLRNRFTPNEGKKGLDIEGKMGQAILAAAGGKVVYSGNGLIGYGNLIIIKHDDRYLSAYGHNSRLLVKEGVEVKQGEKIAEMGDSGKEGSALHFEIRRDGKPVDPLRYLPKHGS